MKHYSTIIFLLLLFSIPAIAQSQRERAEREMQVMEKLSNLKDKETEEETQAQEKILSYKNYTSEKIRENISNLTIEQYESLNSLQSILWRQITDTKKYYPTYKKFLSSEISLLNNYREKVLNRLYEYINNPAKNYQSQTNQATVQYNKSHDELNNCQVDNKKLTVLNSNLKGENEALIKQNEVLKKLNSDLIENSKELVTLTKKGAENLEKSLDALKKKDLKIQLLAEALAKKDSIQKH